MHDSFFKITYGHFRSQCKDPFRLDWKSYEETLDYGIKFSKLLQTLNDKYNVLLVSLRNTWVIVDWNLMFVWMDNFSRVIDKI